MEFEFCYKPLNQKHIAAYWFIFSKDRLLLYAKDDTVEIPLLSDILILNLELTNIHYFGSLDSKDCYTANLENTNIPEGFVLLGLRQTQGVLEDELFWISARAFHIAHWLRKSKFCGYCGDVMQAMNNERAINCPSCNNIIYPRISPAIIVAVLKEDKILLAHSRKFPEGRYSLIAGFVEPGETLEECIKREVKEEVGINIKNIKYYSSQPWPFPDSLMIGFTAEYLSGEIVVDNEEITGAGWYTSDGLPDIPGKVSIARQLIDWFTEFYNCDRY